MAEGKDTTPTIEESLRMIEEKLAGGKKSKKKTSAFSNVSTKKKIIKINAKKINKNDDILLLTKKVDKSGKIIDLKKKKKIFPKLEKEQTNKIKKYQYKILKKTGDMAAIINKLKIIRNQKVNQITKKEYSQEINEEIIKLNETISMAEELFKKELFDL